MIDWSTFERFEGEFPSFFLDQHPDGKYVAMQVATSDAFLAAIWNSETRQLVWSPQNAHALAWLHQGTQIAALENPILSADFLYSIYSWPQGHLLYQCPLHFSMGYLFDLKVSPTNDLAVCQWTDQCEFGFEFVAIGVDNIAQLIQQRYVHRETNISTRPVFRPGGEFWVCAYQDDTSWWNTTSKRKKIGAIMVFHQTQLLGEIPVNLTIPSSYRPPNIMAPGFFSQEVERSSSSTNSSEYLTNLVFLDADSISIQLPTGESQVYDLSQYWHKTT